MIKICLIGSSGRMGSEIIKAVTDDQNTELAGAIEIAGSGYIGKYATEVAGCSGEGCVISSDMLKFAALSDVIIDFSGANGTYNNIEKYKTAGKPVLVGSTGLDAEKLAELRKLSDVVPLLIASNTSLGVNLLAKLVELAASKLGDDFDIEVFEAHHKYKADAPSGTAITLAEAAASGRQVDLKDKAVYGRKGITGPREQGAIGFQVLRGGDITGEHTVFFCGESERIELTHRASSRHMFAKGAVRAAKWLADKPKGLYSMKDVLDL